MNRIILSKEILEDLYLIKMFSIRDIAKHLEINANVVRKYLNIYEIPRRNKSWKASLNKNGKEVPCENCGKLVYRKKYKLNKFSIFYCSWKCEKEHQSKIRSISELPEAWRRRRFYKGWRKRILKRDGFECKLCDSDIKLVAHHIIEAKDNPGLRFELNNGITLCEKCHINIHKNDSHNYIESLQKVISVENLNIGGNLEIDNTEATS
jgi:hypothetical protein